MKEVEVRTGDLGREQSSFPGAWAQLGRVSAQEQEAGASLPCRQSPDGGQAGRYDQFRHLKGQPSWHFTLCWACTQGLRSSAVGPRCLQVEARRADIRALERMFIPWFLPSFVVGSGPYAAGPETQN